MRFPSARARHFSFSVLVCLSLVPGFVTGAHAFQAPDDNGSAYEVDRRGGVKTRPSVMPQAGTQARQADEQARLSRSGDWSRYVAAHPGWVGQWDPSLRTVERAQGPGLAIAGFDGSSPRGLERSARTFLAVNELPSVPSAEKLTFVRAASQRSGHWVHFTQTENGVPVFNTRLTLRITADGRVTGITNRTWPDVNISTTPAITAAQAGRAGAAGLPPGFTAAGEPELMILPIGTGAGAAYRLTWRSEFRTTAPPGDWISFVDALTGELIWRFNNVRYFSTSGTVSGLVEPETGDNNFATIPLPHITVTGVAGGTSVWDTTGADGAYSLGIAGDSLRVSCELAGPFGRIHNTANGNSTPSLGTTVLVDGTPCPLPFDGTNSLASERDAFAHAMLAHDFVNTIEPGYHFLDYQMPIAVELNQTCNAYWDGVGVNFFADGGGCFNTARIETVVLHEYGHGITDFIYRPFFPSGAMHEGFSDYYAATITNQPIMGIGFRGPGTSIRRIDVDKKYPDDWVDEVHADGLIIASALWDMREALGHGTADSLYHFAKYGLSDNFDDYFRDLLDVDDGDGNIYNGTPHFTTLANIFRAHGIGDFSIHVSHVGTPDTEDTLKTFPLTASFLSLFALEAGSVRAHVTITRDGSPAADSLAMTPTGGVREYTCTLPHQPAGTSVSYYFTASDTAGNSVTYPPEGAANPFRFAIGADVTAPVIVHDPLPDEPADIPALRVLAQITDNLDKGLSETRLLYKLNGGAEAPLALAPLPGHFYSADLPLAGTHVGDLFEYRLEAIDSATAPNTRFSPGAGYHAFHLVKGFGRDFEANGGGLSGDGDWQWGIGASNPESTTGQWSTGLAGAYHDQTTSILSLPAVDLTGFTSAALTFKQAMKSEAQYDGGMVEASTDGGATWEILVPDGDYNVASVAALAGPGFSGVIERWTPVAFDLSRYLDFSSVLIRLRFASDQAISGPGWSIDDLQIVERQISARPLKLQASQGRDSQVALRWGLPGGISETLHNPVLGYSVYRAAPPGSAPLLLSEAPVTAREYLDTNVTNGQHYDYYVTALYEGGESRMTGPVDGFPFRPEFVSSASEVHVTIDSVGTVDTLLVISNGGTGELKGNVYTAQPTQTLADVRIHLDLTGSGAAALAPAPRQAGAAVPDHPTADDADLTAAIQRALARGAAKVAKPALMTPPPDTVWTPLFTDPMEASAVDLRNIDAQQNDDLLWFRIGAWSAWADPANSFNLLVAMDTDENQSTGYRGGEYVLMAGAIAWSNFGIPAVILNADLNPLAMPNFVSLPAGGTSAEFGILKETIGRPAAMNLRVYALNAGGSVSFDRAPDAFTAPWLRNVPLYISAPAGTPANLGIRFQSPGLSDGDYLARLIIQTNDPGHPAVFVPLTLTVTGMVPVTLAEFSAVPDGEGVRLTWRTSNEVDHSGFHVYRREIFPESGREERISTAPIPPAPDGRYEYVDRNVTGGFQYEYRLADISRSGHVSFHGPYSVSVPGNALPRTLWLSAATPNPARSRASVRYGIPAPADVTLRIFTIDGRLVRTIENGAHRDAGYYTAEWNGRDDRGAEVPAGVYFYRLDAAGREQARKLMWIR